jgi:hypothetical protein
MVHCHADRFATKVMINMLPTVRRRELAQTGALRKIAAFALLVLAAGCASNGGGSPEKSAAFDAAEQAYHRCLLSYVSSVDDHTSDPEKIADVLATYCLPEFNRYRELSGESEDANVKTAVQVINSAR